MITYVIIKLHSGEQVMASLEEDGNDYIEVSFPMVISAIQVQDGSRIHEHITAKPLCQFSSDKIYRIPKSGILFYKELHEMLIPHYTRIVNAHEESVLVKPQKKLDWEDEPKEMSLEEIRKRIDMLEEFFEETEEEEDKRVFIEGNDTLH
jgi:hypothetical protein